MGPAFVMSPVSSHHDQDQSTNHRQWLSASLFLVTLFPHDSHINQSQGFEAWILSKILILETVA
jgi:hypothetical protein